MNACPVLPYQPGNRRSEQWAAIRHHRRMMAPLIMEKRELLDVCKRSGLDAAKIIAESKKCLSGPVF